MTRIHSSSSRGVIILARFWACSYVFRALSSNNTRLVSKPISVNIWHPEARAIVIFWLREISNKIPRWNAAERDDLWGDDQKSWSEMGRHLTKEVVAKARQLDQHIPTPSEPDTDGSVVWEPSETLKEVGLLPEVG